MTPVTYTVRVRYLLPAQPVTLTSKVINIWGGTPGDADGSLVTFTEGLLLTVRNEEFGEAVEIHAFPGPHLNDEYGRLFTIQPGEVRTFRLTEMQAVAGVVRAEACDSLLHCSIHQFYYHIPPTP